jgi:hypothetical protein
VTLTGSLTGWIAPGAVVAAYYAVLLSIIVDHYVSRAKRRRAGLPEEVDPEGRRLWEIFIPTLWFVGIFPSVVGCAFIGYQFGRIPAFVGCVLGFVVSCYGGVVFWSWFAEKMRRRVRASARIA